MTNARIRLGIDLGGTKIEIVALGALGDELLRRRVPTPSGDYRAIVRLLAALVSETEAQLDATCSVGIGTPGSLSRVDGRIKNSNTVCLNGRPLQGDLEQALGRRIRIANDANCFTLSEATDGAARGAEVVFGVIIGTGTGGGIVVNGELLSGPNGIAGEWGHNPLPWPRDSERPGPACYCGRYGCIETFVSGPGMARDHVSSGAGEADPPAIVAAMDSDQSCRATVERYIDRLSRSLAHVINVLDPDVVVLGGGMSNIDMLYDAIPSQWGRYVFSDRVDTRLVRASHGDSSGVRGAAWLWNR